MLPFRGLSVCLSRSCIVLKRQKISTWFLLLTVAPCLSQSALTFGLQRSTPSSPNFDPKLSDPCWFERRRHSTANCSRTVIEIAQWSQWTACRKPPSLIRMVGLPSLTHYGLPLPPKWGFRHFGDVAFNLSKYFGPCLQRRWRSSLRHLKSFEVYCK